MPRVSVRRGVFETNSSSVHAIVVQRVWWRDSYGEPSVRPVREASEVPLGDFGWEEAYHADSLTKLSYLWTAVVQGSVWASMVPGDAPWVAELRDRWARRSPEWWEDYLRRELDLPEGLVFDHGEDRIDTYTYTDRSDGSEVEARSFSGGIDHVDDLIDFVEAIAENPYLLRDFVYGADSYVWTGNDNDPSGPAVLECDRWYPPLSGSYGGAERFVKHQ